MTSGRRRRERSPTPRGPPTSGRARPTVRGMQRRAPVAIAPPDVDLSVDLGRGLVLRNPILVASGTFGYGIEYGDVVDIERLGAICCKGTTLKPRIGNPTPRVTETPGGMLNSIGLQNPGVDAVVEKYAGTWAGWQVPVIVNVAGESVKDYVEVARRLDGVPGVAGIELNISCPNVGQGGLQFAIDAVGRGRGHGRGPSRDRPAAAGQAVAERRRRAADREGHRGRRRRRADRHQHAVGHGRRPRPGAAAARQRLRRAVGARRSSRSRCGSCTRSPRSVRIPIVAIGGVTELEDVLDFLVVGAVAVQVGTAIFADPTLPVRLIDELAAECGRRGLDSHRDADRHRAAAEAGPRRPPRASSTGREAWGVDRVAQVGPHGRCARASGRPLRRRSVSSDATRSDGVA